MKHKLYTSGMKHKHVIIGSGFAGLRIARLLGIRDDIELLVVNPQSSFEYHGSLYRSANGYSPLETVIPYREIFKDMSVSFIQDFMTDIDPLAKRIRLLNGPDIHYDSATLALGYEPEYFGIPGMREFSHTLYSISDALRLRNVLKISAERCLNRSLPVKVIVAGGGPTGIEVAASIPYFFKLITGHSRVEVVLIEAQSRILGGLPEDFSQLVSSGVNEKIDIRTGLKVIRATKESLHIANSPSIAYDILIWTAGISANSYFRQRPDLFEVDPKGRVIVDSLLRTKHPQLYVAGDSAATRYSGTAHAAIEMGEYIANQVVASMQNNGSADFDATPPQYAVPTGHNSAVAMLDNVVLTGHQGWALRRKLDLEALLLIAPHDVAYSHWEKGDDLAAIFSKDAIFNKD